MVSYALLTKHQTRQARLQVKDHLHISSPKPRGNSTRYTLDRRLSRPKNLSRRFRENNYFALLGIEPGPSSP
jgi:hypothetical protein